MKVVPWWFQTLANVMAVVFALSVGLHVHASGAWIVIYVLTALVSAALPAHRFVGFVGLGTGIVIGVWGTYLLRDAWSALSFVGMFRLSGGALGHGREAAILVIAGVWLVAGSAFRTQRA